MYNIYNVYIYNVYIYNVYIYFIIYIMYIYIYIVLNSKDWSEIVWLPKILCFKNRSCNTLYPKKLTGIHWLGYNDAVSWLNKEYFSLQPIFEIYLYFVCQPAVRPDCARCRAPKISHNKGNGGGFTKMLFQRRFT